MHKILYKIEKIFIKIKNIVEKYLTKSFRRRIIAFVT